MSSADFELSFNADELALVHGWQRKPGSARLMPANDALRQLQSLMPNPSELAEQDEDDEPLLAAQKYALAKYRAGKQLPPDALGDAGAAALLALADHHDPTQRRAWPLVDYWVRESSASYALDVLLLETTLETFRYSLPSVRRVAHGSLLEQGYVGKWQRLREIVSGLSEPEYREVEAHAAQLRESKPDHRVAIAYVFPERPEWAAEAAREVLARAPEPPDPKAIHGIDVLPIDALDFNLLAPSLESGELVCAHFSLWDGVFTDGRAHTLQEQAQGAVINHSEGPTITGAPLDRIADFQRGTFTSGRAHLVATLLELGLPLEKLPMPESYMALSPAQKRGRTVYKSACLPCHGSATIITPSPSQDVVRAIQ